MELVLFALVIAAGSSRSSATTASANGSGKRQSQTKATQNAEGPTLKDYGAACAKGSAAGGIAGTVVPALGTTVGSAVGCIGGLLVTAAKEPAVQQFTSTQSAASEQAWSKLGTESFTTTAARYGEQTSCNIQDLLGIKIAGCPRSV